MKFKILRDYGSYEGFKFDDEDFDTLADAVKYAISRPYSAPFLIVQIIDWEAKLTDTK